MAATEFVRHYIDLSTADGFQFEFLCDRCGSGYLGPIQPAAEGGLGTAPSLPGVAGVGDAARQEALARAIEEARRHFRECGRCSQWVDAACWNEGRGLCVDCEPARTERYWSKE